MCFTDIKQAILAHYPTSKTFVAIFLSFTRIVYGYGHLKKKGTG